MREVGPYAILEVLGQGGQGLVARARAPGGGAPVALKVLVDPPDAAARRRFEQEGAVLARLAHPNLVRVVDRGEVAGRPWLAMELVEGRSLQAVLAAGRPAPAWSARTLAAVGRAVAHLHAHGVVHRDIKPANILLEDRTGRPVLVDLGLAHRDPQRLALSRSDAAPLTATGEVLGTPAYMAPEQADPGGAFGPVGPASDVYGLGATLYALLAGQPPFVGASLYETLLQVLERAPRPPSERAAAVPPALEALALATLAKQPAARPSLEAFVAALEAAATLEAPPPPGARPRPARRPRRGRRAAAAALVVAAGVGAGAWLRRGPAPPAPSSPPAAPPEAGRPATPWPAPAWAASWTWRLAQGGETAASPALWEEDGRTAAPVARALADAPGALGAAFEGPARRVGGDRVAVSYGLPALRVGRAAVGQAALNGGPPVVAPAPADGPDAARFTAADDAGMTWIALGRATWRLGAVRLEAREADGLDRGLLKVELVGTTRGTPPAAHFERRSGLLSVRGTDDLRARAPAALVPAAHRALRFAPGAAPGQRLAVDGAPVEVLDEALGAPPPDGEALLVLDEADVVVRALEVEGRPLTVDRPALAHAPLPAGATPRRLAARFALPDGPPPRGGPLLVLEGPGGEVRLAVDGPRAVLTRGDERLAAAALPAAAARGWLLLERDGDVLVGQVDLDGAGSVRLEAADPFAGPPVAAAWGSSGPRARFDDVEVAAAPPPPVTPALASWRRGAAALARVACPRRLDASLAGADPAARSARREVARAAAQALEAAADGRALPDGVRRDALARAALAWALADEQGRAAAAARRLVEAAGPAAQEVLGALGPGPAPGSYDLLERVVEGWEAPRVPPGASADEAARALALRSAVLAVARVVAPEQDARIRYQEAIDAHELGKLGDAAAAERALSAYRDARAAGADAAQVAPREAQVLELLRRDAEALARWDEATAAESTNYYFWMSRGACLGRLGQADEALVSLLRAVSLGRGRDLPLRALRDWARGPRTPRLHADVAAWALARATGGDARRLREGAAERLPLAPPGRDADLLALVAGVAPRPGDRPTATLARAALPDAARVDALVRHLALLDPDLAPLLGP